MHLDSRSAIVLAAAFAAASHSLAAPEFPKDWIGRWKGDVEVLGGRAGAPTFTKELVIAPTDKPDRFTWTIIYDAASGRQERPYTLVVRDAAQGLYEIDENNGIVLPARLLGGTLLTSFSVQGARIETRERLVIAGGEPRIEFELTTIDESKGGKTGGQGDAPDVAVWTTQTMQRAELKRAPGSAGTQAAPAGSGALAAGEKPVEKTADKPATAAGRDALAPSPTAWTKFTTERYPGKQDDVFFVTPSTGWYLNGAGKIFKTTDAGATWEVQANKPGTYFRCVAFLDEKTGFAGNIGPGYFPNVSDETPLYRTDDGGATWAPVTGIEGPPIVGLCALEVVRTKFVNAGNLAEKTLLFGVGRVGGPTAAIASDDLGKTWRRLALPPSCAMAFDVHFFDANHGVIASATSANVEESRALILSTDDGGKTWREAYTGSRPFELTWKIAFPTRNVGYVTIQSYNPDPKASARFVAKTADGGKTWSEIPLIDDPKVRQFGVAFVSEERGWIGAMPGGFETVDGGKTWMKADFGNAVNKIRVLRDGGATHLHAIGVNVSTLRLDDEKR